MPRDINGHWIPAEGKKDLAKTLRGQGLSPVPANNRLINHELFIHYPDYWGPGVILKLILQ
jgi:hypothetical protein